MEYRKAVITDEKWSECKKIPKVRGATFKMKKLVGKGVSKWKSSKLGIE